MTVRAINDVQFGGPLSLTVCHAVPYTIDTVPPEIHSIDKLTYSETTNDIGCEVVTK